MHPTNSCGSSLYQGTQLCMHCLSALSVCLYCLSVCTVYLYCLYCLSALSELSVCTVCLCCVSVLSVLSVCTVCTVCLCCVSVLCVCTVCTVCLYCLSVLSVYTVLSILSVCTVRLCCLSILSVCVVCLYCLSVCLYCFLHCVHGLSAVTLCMHWVFNTAPLAKCALGPVYRRPVADLVCDGLPYRKNGLSVLDLLHHVQGMWQSQLLHSLSWAAIAASASWHAASGLADCFLLLLLLAPWVPAQNVSSIRGASIQ